MGFDVHKGYCCDFIGDIVNKTLHDQSYTTIIPISYLANRRLFLLEDCPPLVHANMPRKEGERRLGFRMEYCPWCGSKFPQSLGELWREMLSKDYGIDPDDDHMDTIPDEFKTDMWWKNRGL